MITLSLIHTLDLTTPHDKSKLCYAQRPVGQSDLCVKFQMGPKTRFLLLSNSQGFVLVGRPLWQEDGSAIYNCCWSSPEQSFSGPSPERLMTTFCCLRFETHNLEGQVPLFISPRNRVTRLYPQTLGSLFVSSYDSQGYGWGIRPHLYTKPYRKTRFQEFLYCCGRIRCLAILVYFAVASQRTL
jgi:hypothetical protein